MSAPMATPEEMSGYWGWLAQTWPEFALARDDVERAEIMRLLRRRHFAWNPALWLYAVAVAVVAIFAGTRLRGMLAGFVTWLGLPVWVMLVVLVVALLVAYYVGIALLWTRPLRRSLRAELRRRGIAVCQKCGYDCRRQTVARCPECGTAFDEGLLSGGAASRART